MKNNSLPKKPMKAIKEYISYSLILLSAFIYLMGYLKYYFLLIKLDVKCPVNDIFSLTSIFVSGITLCVSMVYVPFVSILGIRVLSKIRAPKNQSFFVEGAVFIISCIIPIFFKTYLLTPIDTPPIVIVISIIGLYCIVNILIKKRKKKYPDKRIICTLLFVVWIPLMCSFYYRSLASEKDSHFDIRANSLFNFDSGTNGFLLTNYRLSPDSIIKDFYEPFTYYQTYGILLSTQNGCFYFYTNRRLYIIPQDSIILFNSYQL